MEINENERLGLGDRMKSYEKNIEKRLEEGKAFIIWLDGHSFSKFTKGMQQPWDPRFVTAMVLTSEDLLTKFHAKIAYTQSDEISLVFLPKENKKVQDAWEPWIFNGRIQKIVSVLSGYASARFNYHLQKLFSEISYKNNISVRVCPKNKEDCVRFTSLRDTKNERVLSVNKTERITSGEAHFDARCIQFDFSHEISNNILWRLRDCYKNAISKTVESLIGNKKCFKKNTTQRENLIEDTLPGTLEKMHPSILHGTFAYKELYTLDNKEESIRSRVAFFIDPYMTRFV